MPGWQRTPLQFLTDGDGRPVQKVSINPAPYPVESETSTRYWISGKALSGLILCNLYHSFILENAMTLSCRDCGSTDLRTSELRPPDFFRLFALRYPVRCRNCRLRWYASIFPALKLPRIELRHRKGSSKNRSRR